MPATESNSFTLDQYRRFFAEEIHAVSGGCSPDLVEAFASVPRELFLGPATWRVPARTMLQPGSYRSTYEPRDLYHDIVVALKEEQLLNTAQPSQMARMLMTMNLCEGSRVVHIGCGVGYYRR